MGDFSCSRCSRPFSYAVHQGDNPDQPLCVECAAHLRAGGAWDRRVPQDPVVSALAEEGFLGFRAWGTMAPPQKPEMTRIYPTCCTSAYCGRVECDGCPKVSVLADFKAWREKHATFEAHESGGANPRPTYPKDAPRVKVSR